MNPRISTLIPTFNRADLLKITIKSVQMQSFKDIQIIVLDDCSDDNTSMVVKELASSDKRIDYLVNEENIGFLANHKKIFSLVETDYFSIISDDDCLFPEFYEQGIKFLDANKDVDVAIFQPLFADNMLNLTNPINPLNDRFSILYPNDGFKSFFDGSINRTWTSMIFRKKCAEIYNEMDPMDFDTGHDMRYLTRVFSRYAIATTNELGAFHRIYDGGLTNTVISNIMSPIANVTRDQRLLEVLNDNMVSNENKIFAENILKRSVFGQIKLALFATAREVYLFLTIYKKDKEKFYEFMNHNFNMESKALLIFYKLIVSKPIVYILSFLVWIYLPINNYKIKKRDRLLTKSSNEASKQIDFLKMMHN